MLLTIITINLNNRLGLKKTIESVVNQTKNNFEYLIIDGASTDGSLDIIKNYEKNIDGWVSEKDNGVYSAMNKGIRMAKGNYLLFLNSGDLLFEPTTIEKMLQLDLQEDLIIFNVKMLTLNGDKIEEHNLHPRDFLIRGSINHQAVLHRKSIFDKIGLYNETLRISACYEHYLLAFFKHNCTYKYIRQILSIYDDTEGLSCYSLNADEMEKERRICQLAVFDKEVVQALKEQELQIKELQRFKALYVGLISSNIVKIALQIIKIKKKTINWKTTLIS
jgi:glycosyltransferase involved in cell wall biosynthesis